jgi:hypothetical protein
VPVTKVITYSQRDGRLYSTEYTDGNDDTDWVEWACYYDHEVFILCAPNGDKVIAEHTWTNGEKTTTYTDAITWNAWVWDASTLSFCADENPVSNIIVWTESVTGTWALALTIPATSCYMEVQVHDGTVTYTLNGDTPTEWSIGQVSTTSFTVEWCDNVQNFQATSGVNPATIYVVYYNSN